MGSKGITEEFFYCRFFNVWTEICIRYARAFADEGWRKRTTCARSEQFDQRAQKLLRCTEMPDDLLMVNNLQIALI